MNNSEVTLSFFFQRRTRRASTYNSGEDTAATPMEVDDAQIVERWLHHCTHGREQRQVQTQYEFITLTEKIPCHVHHFSDIVQGPGPSFSLTRKSSKESHPDAGRVFGEHQQVQELLDT